MQSNIVKFIIISTILVLLLGGLYLGYALYHKPSSEEALSTLGIDAKEYSNSDVEKNNSVSSCWTIVGGVVYDATVVIKNNPDQSEILVKACGRDGSSVYTIQKYSTQALDDKMIIKLKDELFTYKLGIITPSN